MRPNMETSFIISVSFILCLFVLQIVAKPPKKVHFPGTSSADIGKMLYLAQKSRKLSSNLIQEKEPLRQFRIDSTSVPCRNSSFCEGVDDEMYPFDYVESKLRKIGKRYKDFFQGADMPSDLLQVRFLSDSHVELCDSYKRMIHPQLAMNIDRDWRFVINQPSYQQPIRVEICQRKSKQCLFNEAFPNGYSSVCTQKHMKVPLLSLGEDGEFVTYEYEFPSHCQCDLHFNRN